MIKRKLELELAELALVEKLNKMEEKERRKSQHIESRPNGPDNNLKRAADVPSRDK